MRFRHLLLLAGSVLALQSCRKDPIADGVGEFTTTARHTIQVGAPITIDVRGQVLDEGGAPVVGAMVYAGYSSESTVTDVNGVFALNGIRAYSKLGYVKVSKPGFFQGSRSFLPVAGANVVRIHMLARNMAGTVSSAAGGTVQLEGTRIDFGTGGFTRNGQAYSGPVNVYLNHINSTGENVQYEMPGSLVGAKSGEPMPLITFGMVAVELTDAGGSKLEMANGATARVRVPMSPDQSALADPSIDLWHFNDALGYWTYEGTGQLVNGQYEAEVSHFSTWNFDVPNTGCNIQGQVVDQSGSPLQGAWVRFENAAGWREYQTSSTGHYGGMVPLNSSLTMSVHVNCGGSSSQVLAQSVGPFSGDSGIPTVTINSPLLTMVTGTVTNCQGLPAANAYVLVNGNAIFCNNGQFSFSGCSGAATIAASDLGGLSYADPITVTLTGGIMDLGMVQACDVLVTNGSVTDADGNTYTTISFLGQEWMASNLRTSKYANGSTIANVQDNMQWQNLSTGAWRHYDNDAAHDANFGKLYNYYTVTNPSNVCPTGWHVPSQAEWDGLVQVLGGADVAGGKLKEVGTVQGGTGFWNAPNFGATNQVGFNARPGGAHFSNGSSTMGNEAVFWTSDPNDLNFSFMRMIHTDSANVYSGQQYNNVGMSIRCKRD